MVALKVADLTYPRHVSEEVDLLAQALGSAERVYLFLDYDGTLIESSRGLSQRPSGALMRKLDQLSRVDSFSVFVTSERSVDELGRLMGLPRLGLIGQRGLEICRPGQPTTYPIDPDPVSQVIHRLELEAHRWIGEGVKGAFENLGFALSLHLSAIDREVARETSQRFARMVRELDTERRLEILYADGIVEARVAGWHKGDAICHVLKDSDTEDALVIYIGDDVTDEDAFEAVCSWGEEQDDALPWMFSLDDRDDESPPRELTILVSEEPRPTRASLFVRNPSEVYEFLASLAAIASALL